MCKAVSTCVIITSCTIVIIYGIISFGIGLGFILAVAYLLSPLVRVPANGEDLSSTHAFSYLEYAAIMAMYLGLLLFIVAIMGCCTATCVQNTRCCYYTGLVFIILILGTQISAAVVAYIYSIRFDEHGQAFYMTTLKENYVGPVDRSDPTSKAWDSMQFYLWCCGVSGQTDYDKANRWNRTWVDSKAKIPFTCCNFNLEYLEDLDETDDISQAVDHLEDSTCPVSKNRSHINGCYTVMSTIIHTYQMALLVSAGVLGFIEVMVVIAAFSLYPREENDPEGVDLINHNMQEGEDSPPAKPEPEPEIDNNVDQPTKNLEIDHKSESTYPMLPGTQPGIEYNLNQSGIQLEHINPDTNTAQ